MSDDRSRISSGESYQEIGEFWDRHDLDEVWDRTRPVELEVDLLHQRTYVPVDSTLSRELGRLADQLGMSTESLLDLWVREKLAEIPR